MPKKAPSVELVKYSAACRALAIARDVDEVKDIMDKSIAIQVYAKQAKNRQMEADAAEIRIRSERRLGEILKTMPKAKGTAGKGRPRKGGAKKEPPKDNTPTLESQGIDKKLSSRSQKIAEIPEEKFEQKMSEWKEKVVSGGDKIKTDILSTHTHVSKNTGVPEWYTPAEYIEAARVVFGKIDLDPATSAIAQKTVKAKRFYTADDDGLSKKWKGNVWLNPPYAADLCPQFVEKLCGHVEGGDVQQSILLVNNATETKWFQRAANVATAICFPASRVKFLDEEGKPGAPLQGQAAFYFGLNHRKFIAEYRMFGFVVRTA